MSTAYGSVRATQGYSTGKWYWEIEVDSIPNNYLFVGVGESSDPLNYYPGYTAVGYCYYSSNGATINDNNQATYGTSYTTGDIIGVALDMDNGKIW